MCEKLCLVSYTSFLPFGLTLLAGGIAVIKSRTAAVGLQEAARLKHHVRVNSQSAYMHFYFSLCSFTVGFCCVKAATELAFLHSSH